MNKILAAAAIGMNTIKKLVAGLAIASATLVAPFALPAAHADHQGGAGYSNLPDIDTHPVNNSPDARFFWLLTNPKQDHPFVVWNFPLVRSQGIAACQREDAGETPYQATKDLEYPNGPYTFDDANNITSSAETIYCPSHTNPALPMGGVNMSTPVYPPPVYPPLAWYSPPVYSGPNV